MPPTDRDLLELIADQISGIPERVRGLEESAGSAHHRLDQITDELDRVVGTVNDLATGVKVMGVQCDERQNLYRTGAATRAEYIKGQWAAIVQLIITIGAIIALSITTCDGGAEDSAISQQQQATPLLEAAQRP